MRKSPHLRGIERPHQDVVIRRDGAIKAIEVQLTDRGGISRFPDPSDTRVIYGSPLVDVAANLDLARETIEICNVILRLTHWQIRLLSKSTFLPFIAKELEAFPELHARQRVVYGVSTGTLDDEIAAAVEKGCPLVSRRIESLHRLQDAGFRTFGMICPSLPQPDYAEFSHRILSAIRAERCEHIWAEVINVRGESMARTFKALNDAGFHAQAAALLAASVDRAAWEEYARATFQAHAAACPPGKLRFLQYVTNKERAWWDQQREHGAVLL